MRINDSQNYQWITKNDTVKNVNVNVKENQ